MVDEVSAQAAWAALGGDARAQLCDVRTPAEWRDVGVPDLDGIGKRTHFVSWQAAPGVPPDPDFAAALMAAGVTPDQPVYFLCRSGMRSRAAATAAQAAGFSDVHNVSEGFEGRPGAPGWAALGLPVTRR